MTPLGFVGVKVTPEIVGLEEKKYAASGLISNTRRLHVIYSPRKRLGA